MFSSYSNELIDFQSKSVDSVLYDGNMVQSEIWYKDKFEHAEFNRDDRFFCIDRKYPF